MQSIIERRVFAVLLALCAAALLVPGCMAYVERDSDPSFSEGVQQDDIPVPRYFQFDKEQSYAFIRYASPGPGSFRSWTGYYYGDQQVGNLVPWYVQQMGADGWSYRDTQTEQEKKRLSFQKGEETATIWLYREFDHRDSRYKTVVKAEIHPTRTVDLTPEQILSSQSTESSGVGPAPLAKSRSPRAPEGTVDVSAPPAKAAVRMVRQASPAPKPLKKAAPPASTAARPAVPTREPAGSKAATANKPVVIDEVGAENNEDPQAGDEFAPDDEK